MNERNHDRYEAVKNFRINDKLSYKEIGRRLGITSQRAHQIGTRILNEQGLDDPRGKRRQ